jgi:hypothetical protein
MTGMKTMIKLNTILVGIVVHSMDAQASNVVNHEMFADWNWQLVLRHKTRLSPARLFMNTYTLGLCLLLLLWLLL